MPADSTRKGLPNSRGVPPPLHAGFEVHSQPNSPAQSLRSACRLKARVRACRTHAAPSPKCAERAPARRHWASSCAGRRGSPRPGHSMQAPAREPAPNPQMHRRATRAEGKLTSAPHVTRRAAPPTATQPNRRPSARRWRASVRWPAAGRPPPAAAPHGRRRARLRRCRPRPPPACNRLSTRPPVSQFCNIAPPLS